MLYIFTHTHTHHTHTLTHSHSLTHTHTHTLSHTHTHTNTHTHTYTHTQFPPNTTGLLTIFDFDPEEVARQMTIIDFSLFAKIKPAELLNQVCLEINL